MPIANKKLSLGCGMKKEFFSCRSLKVQLAGLFVKTNNSHRDRVVDAQEFVGENGCQEEDEKRDHDVRWLDELCCTVDYLCVWGERESAGFRMRGKPE